MNNFNSEKIKHVMHKELENQNTPSNFEGLWEDYTMKKNGLTHKKLYKAFILAAAITAISATSIYAEFIRRDSIDIPFKSDSQILGTWKAVDFVTEINEFNVNQPSSAKEDLYLQELHFNTDSSINLKVQTEEGISSIPCPCTWTKGFVLNPVDFTASKYHIKEINNEQYMFMEWKSGDYTFGRLDKPYYYVLKKTTHK